MERIKNTGETVELYYVAKSSEFAIRDTSFHTGFVPEEPHLSQGGVGCQLQEWLAGETEEAKVDGNTEIPT